MTDITINIKTGSDNSEPKVSTTTDNDKTIVPRTESPEVVTPKEGTKEENILDKEPPKKDDPAEINMLDKEQAIMGDDKTNPSEEDASKQEVPKGVMKEDQPSGKDDAKEMDMTEEEHAKMNSSKD